jgi:hypothetical protein
MSVSCECCVLRYTSLSRADHSLRGTLPSVVCLSVIVNLDKEEVLPHWGLLRHLEKNKKTEPKGNC